MKLPKNVRQWLRKRKGPITIEGARRALEAAVATQGPDFVYCDIEAGCGTCLNVVMPPKGLGRFETFPGDRRQQTACLVAVALSILGETRHTLPKNQSCSVHFLSFLFEDMITREAANYLDIAQRSQDGGSTWGEAFERAELALLENRGRVGYDKWKMPGNG